MPTTTTTTISSTQGHRMGHCAVRSEMVLNNPDMPPVGGGEGTGVGVCTTEVGAELTGDAATALPSDGGGVALGEG